jgi:hypothetical protein
MEFPGKYRTFCAAKSDSNTSTSGVKIRTNLSEIWTASLEILCYPHYGNHSHLPAVDESWIQVRCKQCIAITINSLMKFLDSRTSFCQNFVTDPLCGSSCIMHHIGSYILYGMKDYLTYQKYGVEGSIIFIETSWEGHISSEIRIITSFNRTVM